MQGGGVQDGSEGEGAAEREGRAGGGVGGEGGAEDEEGELGGEEECHGQDVGLFWGFVVFLGFFWGCPFSLVWIVFLSVFFLMQFCVAMRFSRVRVVDFTRCER